MRPQVHFLGLDVTHAEVRASLLHRDGAVVAALRRPLEPLRDEVDRRAFAPAAWARAIGDAARDAIEAAGTPTSKIWGYAPVAPPGWIILDVEWRPMTDLFLAKEPLAGRVAEEIGRFLEAERRARARIGLVLPPKDFLRFHWSKVIATDSSGAAALGLLGRSGRDWDNESLERAGLRPDWLPPVLPPAFACGRVGFEGTEATTLQSTAWSATGSTTRLARIAGCGLLERPALYVFADRPTLGYWIGPPREAIASEPALAGEERILSAPLDSLPADALADDTPIVLDWAEGEDPASIASWARGSGRSVFAAPFAGGISPGAAVLAALASGAYANAASFYRRFARPQPLDEAISR